MKKEVEQEIKDLEDVLSAASRSYRAGNPTMTDEDYDRRLARLAELDPNNQLIQTVEDEPNFGAGKVKHAEPMLSTEKAYDSGDIKKWISRILAAAKENDINMSEVVFKATPKLDGMAGKYLNNKLVTRGDGEVGNDITSSLDKGIYTVCGANTGVGEVVMLKDYFNKYLSEEFSHPRNVVVGVVSADNPNDHALEALKAKAIQFMPYTALKAWRGSAIELIRGLDEICAGVEDCQFPVDGTVIEIEHTALKEIMGSGSHHHNWQIAKKSRGESAICKVVGITWQVGRTGRVTPVINIEPTKISGAMISNVTGHHAGNIMEKGIGPGAKIEVIRSGEVIPYLAKVVEGVAPECPDVCPSCSAKLEFAGDFLECNSWYCSAQVESRLLHWFGTMGNVDGFGPSTIKKLVDSGYTTIIQVQCISLEELIEAGFGAGQASNLIDELGRSQTTAINDWRFLAAFGIHHLGRGDSKKILAYWTIEELRHMSASRLLAVDGFGGLTSKSIAADIKKRLPEIMELYHLGYDLIKTKQSEAQVKKKAAATADSAIKGAFIVFTGGMVLGTRDAMKKSAEDLGATPQSSINKKTTILVIGNKASAAKITKAEGLGAKVITEAEYYAMNGILTE